MRGLLFLFILLLSGWYAFSGYWYNCKIKNRCLNKTVQSKQVKPVKTEEKKQPVPITKPALLTENPTPLSISGYNFKNSPPKGNIYFGTDAALMDKPIIDKTVSPYLEEIASHLKANPISSNLQITGYYTNKEANNYKGKNLGLSRAGNVKDYLVNIGLDQSQIEIKSLQNNNLKIFNNSITGAINLTLKVTKTLVDTIKTPTPKAAAIEQETKTVYFKYNSSEIIITKELKDYVERLKLYLKQETGKQVVVTGHTDSFGQAQQNVKLGLQRANFVKQFLTENGITSKQVKTDSKGPAKPIASNKTAEGRKQNRRVEITFN